MISNQAFSIGINIDGVLEHDGLPALTVDQRFDWVANAKVFDYVEINPAKGEDFKQYIRASQRVGVPIGVMGGIFCLGPDTLDVFAGLNQQAGALGCRVFNCQVFSRNSAGADVTLEEMGQFYLQALEIGQKNGCPPSLEVHVDMWTECFARVNELGEWLAQRGAPLHLTLDHSHLIFKIDNPEELAHSGLGAEPDLGRSLLHPDSPHNFYAQWLERGWIAHAHTRSVQINGVPNPLTTRGDLPGRGIQYPFVQPPQGSYHQAWDESELVPWKRAVEKLLQWKKAHPASAFNQISCEFIPFPDYGGGARYSIFEQNVACAKWLRQLMRDLQY